MLDIEELRILLKFEGIDLTDYTDEEITVLINSKTRELKGLLGLDIIPVHRKETSHHFRGEKLRLDFYPVKEMHAVIVDGEYLKHKDYSVDYNLGILRFKNKQYGSNVTVEYLSGLSDDDMETLIKPLISDMVIYTLTSTDPSSPEGLSSVKEGDVSVSYDTSNSRGALINNRITDIRNRFNSARLRFL